MRIVVVADSHLAPGVHAFDRNWDAVRAFVSGQRVDLTVHLGDITVDGLSDPAHFRHAVTMSADWPTPIRYLPAAERRRLLELTADASLRAAISGHTHQYRDRTVEGLRHVWVPSTAFYLPDGIQDRVGEKVTGVEVLELEPGRLRFHLVCPEGLVRNRGLDHPVYPELVEARRRVGTR